MTQSSDTDTHPQLDWPADPAPEATVDKTEATGDTQPALPALPAGRIVHDERGNAVWNWSSNDKNRTSIGSTSQMLKRLELANLHFEGETPPQKADEEEPAAPQVAKKRGSGYGPGYNPYDRTAPVRQTPQPKKAPRR